MEVEGSPVIKTEGEPCDSGRAAADAADAAADDAAAAAAASRGGTCGTRSACAGTTSLSPDNANSACELLQSVALGKEARAGAPVDSTAKEATAAHRPRLQQRSLDWDSALAALRGTGPQKHAIRPHVVRASKTTQVFVERPPVHRMTGGDKWRNSGGKRGGIDYWADERTGVRKRYGRVVRGKDRAPLKFMHFSLLHRAAEGVEIEEDLSVRMYTVEATEGAEAEEEPPKTLKRTWEWGCETDSDYVTPTNGPRSVTRTGGGSMPLIDMSGGQFSQILHGFSRKMVGSSSIEVPISMHCPADRSGRCFEAAMPVPLFIHGHADAACAAAADLRLRTDDLSLVLLSLSQSG
jgi:hypothetical protein